MNYYKHHLGDYATRTQHLTLLEHGVYRLLIDAHYIAEGPLPADLDRVCRIVRAQTKPERQAVKMVLNEFFTLTPDGYFQKRVMSEIAEYQEKSAQNAINGAANRKRNGTQSLSETEPSRLAKRSPERTHTHTHTHKPLANSHKPEEISNDISRGAIAPEPQLFFEKDFPPEPEPPPEKPQKPPKTSRKRCAIPADWEIVEGDKNHEFAGKNGMDWADLVREEAKFKNHHLAKGEPLMDWDAAWRTWVLRRLEFSANKRG